MHPHLVLSLTRLPSMIQTAQLRYILMTTAMIMRYSTCSLRKSSIQIYSSPPEPQLVPQNDSHVTSVAPSMVQSEGTVETSFATNEETRAHQETVYRNLVDQVAQFNMKMTLEVHNWSSSAHKEVHIIISHKISPIINQVDARMQNFEIQFLQEAAKFDRDFKSLTEEADESLDKQK
nr:hypothetical protein [Tanacetum cinerariifolium]